MLSYPPPWVFSKCSSRPGDRKTGKEEVLAVLQSDIEWVGRVSRALFPSLSECYHVGTRAIAASGARPA